MKERGEKGEKNSTYKTYLKNYRIENKITTHPNLGLDVRSLSIITLNAYLRIGLRAQ